MHLKTFFGYSRLVNRSFFLVGNWGRSLWSRLTKHINSMSSHVRKKESYDTETHP